MKRSYFHFGFSRRLVLIGAVLCALAMSSAQGMAQGRFVRVNQAGYEAGSGPYRAYLMSTAAETGKVFYVILDNGTTVSSGAVGAVSGTWSTSATVKYNVYALDFSAPAGDVYRIKVEGSPAVESPKFAVDTPDKLYSGLLLNTLFFYRTQRDGAEYIPNALRSAPGHLKDEHATVYQTPPIDDDDYVNNAPPAAPLVPAGLPKIDASGGWWDAGDYEKYVETISYADALMEIGVRDFPGAMGAQAQIHPPAPPVAVSYAGQSGPGAPASADFSSEARFGVDWLLKMWDDTTKTLYYQVDNTQDFNYYGYGDPTSAQANCGGTYDTPYCLVAEYDIWTLPQAADNYLQPGDPRSCDPYTTVFICNRPVFVAAPAGSKISPNLAGRLAASFALCYQLNRSSNATMAAQCLKSAEDVFALAKTSLPDPCGQCLTTIVPFDGYPESTWDDDMELGATELYFALQSAGGAGNLPAGLPVTDPKVYLRKAAQFAANYISKISNQGGSDALNLYDVSGLAHFELARAIQLAGNPSGLSISKAGIEDQLLKQLEGAVSQSQSDAWGFGLPWQYFDTASHGAGISVMASELAYLTGNSYYSAYAQRWQGNILGANPWGTSFIVGDGSVFPNCIQHQVANLAGALNGTSGGTPVLWGAVVEGPNYSASSGLVDGMILCPANGVDSFARFNGNDGAYDASATAVYQDNMQSYSTTEPGIDLTATSFLMWSWRMAGRPSF